MELDHLVNRHPFNLSGGEKQRLQIALASVAEAKLLIFDEPTSGLDQNRLRLVVEQLKELQKKASILIITHDYELITTVAQRVIYINNHTIEQDFLLNNNKEILDHIFKDMEENVDKEEIYETHN